MTAFYERNKIREEHDSGINYLIAVKYIQLLSYMLKRQPIQVQLARA